MAGNGQSRWIVVTLVWLVIFGLGAVAFRFVVQPWMTESSRRTELLTEYEQLSAVAAERGLPAVSLPEDADAGQIATAVGDLKQRLTGAAPLPPAGDAATVAVALDSFSGYCLWRSPALRKQLAAGHITLELVDDGADYPRRMRALKSGKTPLAVFTVDALIKASADLGQMPGTIVMLIDETIGADAMVAYESAIPNIDALNSPNARIVTTRHSPSETLARVVMANFRLPELADEPWIDADGAADVLRRFQQADRTGPNVFVLWEPYVTRALAEDGAHVLMDSSRFRGYIVDVLVAQRDYLIDHEPVVRAIVEAYQRVAYEQRRGADGMAALVFDDARRSGEKLSRKQAQDLVERIWWKTTQENYTHMGVASDAAASDLQPLHEMIRNITAVLLRTGAITADPAGGNPPSLYYDRVLRSMHEANFHPALIRPSAQAAAGNGAAPAPDIAALSDPQWAQLRPVGTLRVERIIFARGTARLTRQSQRALDQLAQTLRSWPQYYLQVHGHARREGDPQANRQLAQARADMARTFLIDKGTDPHRVKVIRSEPRDNGGQAQSVTFVLGQTPY